MPFRSPSANGGDAAPRKPRATMPRLVLLALLLLPGPTPALHAQARQFSWRVVEHDGRDYVSLQSVKEFYRFPQLVREGRSVKLVAPALTMDMRVGSQELLINNVKFILSFAIIEKGGDTLMSRLDLAKIVDPVLRPAHIRDSIPFRTVVIDAGHGGHDTGARSTFGTEKDYALDLATRLQRLLVNQGFNVVMTRDRDVFVSLPERVRIANQHEDAIFISLHFNSASNRSARGIETFALSPQGASSAYGARANDASAFAGNRRDAENIALATAVHASVLHHIPSTDRGIKRARWAVLRGVELPGILFEGGFLSNAEDARLIASPEHRQRMALAIAAAVVSYRNALGR